MALHELRNPKKPSQFIKTYVDKQLNTLKAEIPQPNQHQLHEDNRAPLNTRSETATGGINQQVEALGEVYGTSNIVRESDRISK